MSHESVFPQTWKSRKLTVAEGNAHALKVIYFPFTFKTRFSLLETSGVSNHGEIFYDPLYQINPGVSYLNSTYRHDTFTNRGLFLLSLFVFSSSDDDENII